MSLRREILKEIKSLLSEAMSTRQALDKANQLTKYFSKMDNASIEKENPGTAEQLLEAFYVLFTQSDAQTAGGTEVTAGRTLHESLSNKYKIINSICRIGNTSEKYSRTITIKGATGPNTTVTICPKVDSATPTPPEPPKPKPGLKGPGCKPGSSFIGLNGVTSGEGVASVQAAFSAIYAADVKFDRRGFTYNGKMDERGTFGAATEEAVLEFQKTKGGKYAAKIQSQLGSSLGNPDGCVGPKTGCALVIASDGRAVAGYDMAKCKAKFGANKIAQKKLAAAEPEESTTKVAESKNWLDRTREDTTSSLFERLVKDVSKKKVI